MQIRRAVVSPRPFRTTPPSPFRILGTVPKALRGMSLVVVLLAAACVGPPPPRPVPPPPPAPTVPEAPAPVTEVWTREPGVVLRGDASAVTVPHLFTRLTILRADSAGLLVQCGLCRGQPIGRVDTTKVVGRVREPRDARRMELADFALAVREAARRRDYEALRTVMTPDFVHSLAGGEGALPAIGAWRAHRFNDLALFPALLDRGIANVAGTGIWAAPPEYAGAPGYRDLRAGFRRGRDGWEWIFLVRAD